MLASLLLVASLASPPQVYRANVPVAASSLAQDPPPPPPCDAVVQWTNDTQMIVNRGGARPLTLFTAVGRGRCSPSVIVLSAVYFDANDDVVCGGQVDLEVSPGATPYTNLEVRPGNLYEFLRWRNGPRATAQQWFRLICMNPDGLSEVQPAELERARSMRLHATITPQRSGIAAAEIRMLLQP